MSRYDVFTEPVNHVDLLGTEFADGPSTTFEQRRGRCYELAAYAMAFGVAPTGTMLVHGSWTGPIPKERIGHAWLVLPGVTQVWEPIRARVYGLVDFYRWTRCRGERIYDIGELRELMMTTGHYGRWHDSPYR